MSELQKSFAKAKLQNLPFDPPLPLNALPDDNADSIGSSNLLDGNTGYHGADAMDEDEDAFDETDELRPLPEGYGEDDSSSASSASSASSVGSTGTIRPEPRRRLFARVRGTPTANGRPTTYSPLPWHPYFSQEFYLTSPTTPLTHHVYFTAPSKPSAPLFVLQHGAGSSALSFAACCAEIRKLAPEVGLLAPEARGHGETTIKPEFVDKETENGVLNMELDRLGTDLEAAIELTKDKMGWTDLPNIIMIGHSLGGAIVTHVAKGGRLGVKLLAFAVLDVVEGSAMDALKSMQSYLASRPKNFQTVESGIEWHVRSRTVRGLLSARISVPSILFPPLTTSNTSTSPETAFVIDDTTPPSTAPTNNMSIPENSTPPFNPVTTTPPANNFPSHPQTLPLPPPSGVWTWRTDLSTTSDYWENWFGGMSSKFLSSRGGKLLLLAGTDRLDKELMIGQMQGKYQLQVFPEAGHFIQEDLPEKTAMVLVDFWKRNDGKLVLPPKVSAMMAAKHAG